uniref:Uncharacterized protein n=1 Tax=Aegilops tauschii subsp. strangulata TaxID=200361 RepID=A0A453AUN2_AEGTS
MLPSSSGGLTRFSTLHRPGLRYGMCFLSPRFRPCYIHRPRHPHSNSNLAQVPRHGRRSRPVLLCVLAGCQGEAHLLPKDVPTGLREDKLEPLSSHGHTPSRVYV